MKSDYKSDAVKRMQRRLEFIKSIRELGWESLNDTGKLKAILMSDLGSKGLFDRVYDVVVEYVRQFNQFEVEAILKDERQIARHAMIIKLTRL